MRLFARSSSASAATLMLAVLAAALTVLKPVLMSPFRPVASAYSACRYHSTSAWNTSARQNAAHFTPRQEARRYPQMQNFLDCCWYALQGPCTVHLQSSIHILCCQVQTQLQIHQEAERHWHGQ